MQDKEEKSNCNLVSEHSLKVARDLERIENKLNFIRRINVTLWKKVKTLKPLFFFVKHIYAFAFAFVVIYLLAISDIRKLFIPDLFGGW